MLIELKEFKNKPKEQQNETNNFDINRSDYMWLLHHMEIKVPIV